MRHDSEMDTELTAVGERESSPTIKSLSKGLQVLELLLNHDDVGTVDVSRALSIDKGAASRILRTLVDAGFAVQGVARRYRLSPRLASRGSQFPELGGVSLKERARPLLERIYRATHETAHLAIRADNQVLYLDKIDTDMLLRVDRPVGTLSPLHCTALGKVLLAFQDAPLPRNLAHFTDHTPIDVGVLQAQLRDIAQRGYARDDEEFAEGVRCVAAPLRDLKENVVAAIGISGPAARISVARLDEYGALLRDISRNFLR